MPTSNSKGNAMPCHDMFLQRLATEYAITGEVVTWMRSYLVNREQNISINNTLSDKITLDFGFPQGSCIGPFGFKLYTKPLTSIAKKHNVNIHLYADDTQLYVPFDPCNMCRSYEKTGVLY